MKLLYSVIILFALSVATLGITIRRAENGAASAAPSATNSAPVVVELFTSEGCSSCPPADALLAKLDAEKRVDGVEIIALEEHVDYWDSLGWRDPYSSPLWTARQTAYAEAFRASGAYTPQMVVDGADEFVGSRERQARQSIRAAAQKPKASVSVESHEGRQPGAFQLKIAIQMLPSDVPADDTQVWLAVTETGLHSNVTRGENAGEDLHHAAVVRSLQKIGALGKSSMPYTVESAIRLNPAWNREHVRFVVFVQDKKTLHILGAASVNPV
jgi:hypothetical protein